MIKLTLKILCCEHHKIFEVAIFQHYSYRDFNPFVLSLTQTNATISNLKLQLYYD